MKVVASIGNVESATLMDTRRIGTEPNAKIQNYIKKVTSEDGDYYTDALRDIQSDIANDIGSLVAIDRTISVAKMAEITAEGAQIPFTKAKVIIDTIAGDRDVGNGHINTVLVSRDGEKFEIHDSDFIVKPRISLNDFAQLVMTMAQKEYIDDTGMEALSRFTRINSTTAVALFALCQEHLTEKAKVSRELLKMSIKIGVDFDSSDAALRITDFRGIRWSDVNLLNAVEQGFYNKEDYSDYDNNIIEDMRGFIKENHITLKTTIRNTNFIDFGHDEVGNIIVNKNAMIAERKNGYMFKNLGLSEVLQEINAATVGVKKVLNNLLSDEDRIEVARSIEAIKNLALQTQDTLIMKSAKLINTDRIANANDFSSIQKEFKNVMDVAFAIKTFKLNGYAKENSILLPKLTESGDGRLVHNKFSYMRDQGIGLHGETIIQRTAALHEIRPLSTEEGVQGGMQVKSKKVTAVEFIFDKDGGVMGINNAASLSQYNATWNKLSLILNMLIEGKYDAQSDTKKPLTDAEFTNIMHRGAVYGEDETGEPKYSELGLQSIIAILEVQKTNQISTEAIVAFKQRIENVYREHGVLSVSDYIKQSHDKLIEVFRQFEKSAFPQYSKNRNIGKVQWLNRETVEGEQNPTKVVLDAIYNGADIEALHLSFDTESIRNARSLLGKAQFVKTTMEIADSLEEKRLLAMVESGEIDAEVSQYYSASNIASDIGYQEYKIKNRIDRYYDTDINQNRLSSPTTNFSHKTDSGILIVDEGLAMAPDLNIVKSILEHSHDVKQHITVVLSGIIEEQYAAEQPKRSHLHEGESVTLDITTTTSEPDPNIASSEEAERFAAQAHIENRTDAAAYREARKPQVEITIDVDDEEQSMLPVDVSPYSPPVVENEVNQEKMPKNNSTDPLVLISHRHELEVEVVQRFVEEILDRMIFDGERLTDLFTSLPMQWRERMEKESAFMKDFIPLLQQLSKGEEISGLDAYINIPERSSVRNSVETPASALTKEAPQNHHEAEEQKSTNSTTEETQPIAVAQDTVSNDHYTWMFDPHAVIPVEGDQVEVVEELRHAVIWAQNALLERTLSKDEQQTVRTNIEMVTTVAAQIESQSEATPFADQIKENATKLEERDAALANKEEVTAPYNDIGLDAAYLDIEDEAIMVQKASEAALFIQEEHNAIKEEIMIAMADEPDVDMETEEEEYVHENRGGIDLSIFDEDIEEAKEDQINKEESVEIAPVASYEQIRAVGKSLLK